MSKEPPKTRLDFTRRSFLGNTGLTGGALFFAGQAADVARGETREQGSSTNDTKVQEEALIHFDIDQARVVQAMAARIFPADGNGPGAAELGVVYFIDRQLAGSWGQGDKWYMNPPFVNEFEGAIPNQGWQSNLVPAEVYEFALGWIAAYANKRFGAGFTDLPESQQDSILSGLENDDPDNFRSIKPSEFFALFQENVIEGVYCDPTYGGNRNMAGWRMKRFPGSPGSLGSYKQLIGREKFIRIPPRDIKDDVEESGVETGTESSGNAGKQERRSRYELDETEANTDG